MAAVENDAEAIIPRRGNNGRFQTGEKIMAKRFTVIDLRGDHSEFTIEDSSTGLSGTYIRDRQASSDAIPQARWEFGVDLVLIEERIGPGLPKKLIVLIEKFSGSSSGDPIGAAWTGTHVFEFVLKSTSSRPSK
jgi:hypothetical protein